MVLENVKEMWTIVPKAGKGKKKSKPINKVSNTLNIIYFNIIIHLYVYFRYSVY